MLGPVLPPHVVPPQCALLLWPGHMVRGTIWLENPCGWVLSARPMHSRVSSDSILMIEGRVWSREANSVALREVLPFGLGLEKLKWELWQATARACLSTLSVAANRVRVGLSLARWRDEWIKLSQDEPSQTTELFHILDAKQCSLANGICVFLAFFLHRWSPSSLNLKIWSQL